MPRKLNPELQKQLAAQVEYYREMGIHDFFRRTTSEPITLEEEPVKQSEEIASVPLADAPDEHALPTSVSPTVSSKETVLPVIQDKRAALQVIREDIGDCTRCKLHPHRTNIVFGVGNLNPDLMFVGEGPGADEDAQGEPFVGRAGQLLNNMITAMGIRREDVYIANVVKCRPPGNRTPEKDESDTCGPFLLRQIDVIRPKAIVALGATAAKCLLAFNDSLGNLRGRWYDYKGMKLAVTYHPAYLLRDPARKKDTWQDLQMVMKYLGLKPAKSGQE
jgi:uracil-DNA glycosylase